MWRLSRFWRLKPADQLFLVRCVWQLGLIRLGLRMRGYQRVSRALQSSLPRFPGKVSAPRIIWGVRTAAQFLPRSKCLASAVTLHYLLARSGHASVVRVGIAKDSQMSFDAHAWVIHDGQIVIGDSGPMHDRYTTMTDLQLKLP